jgi:tetratricopeptide (TPR) repeat protein
MVKPDFIEKVDKRIRKVSKISKEQERNEEYHKIVFYLINSNFFDKALEVAELITAGRWKIKALCDIAPGIALRAKQPDKSLAIINQAKELYYDLTDEHRKRYALHDIGVAYGLSGFIKEAHEIIQMLPEECDHEKSDILGFTIASYLREDRIDEAIRIAISIPNAARRNWSLNDIIRFLAKNGDYYKAIYVCGFTDEPGKRSMNYKIAEILAKSVEKHTSKLGKKAMKNFKRGKTEDAIRELLEVKNIIMQGLDIASKCNANSLIARWSAILKMINDAMDKPNQYAVILKPDSELPIIGTSLIMTPMELIESRKSSVAKTEARINDVPPNLLSGHYSSMSMSAYFIALDYALIGKKAESLEWFRKAVYYQLVSKNSLIHTGRIFTYPEAFRMLESVIQLNDSDLDLQVHEAVDGISIKPYSGDGLFESYIECVSALNINNRELAMERLKIYRELEAKYGRTWYVGLADIIEGILEKDDKLFLDGLHRILPTFRRRIAKTGDIPICIEALNLMLIARRYGMTISLTDVDSRYHDCIPRIFFD